MSKKSTSAVPPTPRGDVTTVSTAGPVGVSMELGADAVLLPPIPCCPPPEGGYVPQHVDVRLTDRQGRALRRTFEGLDRSGAIIANAGNRRGRVVGPADAVKWLLERLADAHEQFDAAAPVVASADPGVSLPEDMLGTR